VSASLKLSSPTTQQFWEVAILYEDDHVLALDKPAGLATASDPANPDTPNLADLLYTGIERGVPWSREQGRAYLAPAHRLDSPASGLILLAKNKHVLAALLDAFGVEKPGRAYVVLVQGTPAEDRFQNGAKVAPNPVQPGAFRVDPHHGKRSRTAFEVIEKFGGYTLLKSEAWTDRPHQVRVHLRNLGLPLVGDELYGGRPLLLSRLKRDYRLKPNRTERPLIARAAIHAEALSFTHPATGAALTIAAPWPKDLTVAVKYLRRYAAAEPAGIEPWPDRSG
jgi:RluA family pseudouridine synthase